jgi:hypothetical protein
LERPSGPSYPMVAVSCRRPKLKFNIMSTARGLGSPLDCDLDGRILSALNDFPFHRLRGLSTTLKRPLSTIRNHLARAGRVLKHSKRLLTSSPQGTGVELEGGMPRSGLFSCRE